MDQRACERGPEITTFGEYSGIPYTMKLTWERVQMYVSVNTLSSWRTNTLFMADKHTDMNKECAYYNTVGQFTNYKVQKDAVPRGMLISPWRNE